jgi:hypothetical protein
MITTFRNTILMFCVLAFGACAMNEASSDRTPQQKPAIRTESKNADMKAGQPSAEARLLGQIKRDPYFEPSSVFGGLNVSDLFRSFSTRPS